MSPRRAFTLVELVVVILVLGILAGIATGRFLDAADEGRASALRASLEAYALQIELKTAANGGQIPGAILPRWFTGGSLPTNPYNTSGVPSLHRINNDTLDHPNVIVLQDSSAGAFWYNAANGVIRARVPSRGRPADTLAFYNEINGTPYDGAGAVGGGGS